MASHMIKCILKSYSWVQIWKETLNTTRYDLEHEKQKNTGQRYIIKLYISGSRMEINTCHGKKLTKINWEDCMLDCGIELLASEWLLFWPCSHIQWQWVSSPVTNYFLNPPSSVPSINQCYFSHICCFPSQILPHWVWRFWYVNADMASLFLSRGD